LPFLPSPSPYICTNLPSGYSTFLIWPNSPLGKWSHRRPMAQCHSLAKLWHPNLAHCHLLDVVGWLSFHKVCHLAYWLSGLPPPILDLFLPK
jgi:hypothetical protein